MLTELTTKNPLAPLCKDTFAHIVSFLPYLKQRNIIAPLPKDIKEHFAPLATLFFQYIPKEQTKPWEQLLEKAQPFLPPIKENLVSRLVKLLALGTQFENSSSTDEYSLDIHTLWKCLENGDEPKSILSFVSHFRKIRKLSLFGGKHYPEWTYFLLRCMPRLKTIVVDEDECMIHPGPEQDPITQLWSAPSQPYLHQQAIDKLFTTPPFALVVMDETKPYGNSAYDVTFAANWTDVYHEEDVFLNLDLIQDFHISSFHLCATLEQLLAPELCITHADRISKSLHIISHCQQFSFDPKLWLTLIQIPSYRVIFDAIVARIKSGDTLHCFPKLGRMFATSRTNQLFTSLQNVQVVIAFAREGFQFDSLDVPRDISPVVYDELLHNGVFFHYSFSNLQQLDFASRFGFETFGFETSLVKSIHERVRQYTLTQVHTKSFVVALSECREVELICAALLNLMYKSRKEESLKISLSKNWGHWSNIVKSLLGAQHFVLLDWFLSLSPKLVKQHINYLLSKWRASSKYKPSQAMAAWLIDHHVCESDSTTQKRAREEDDENSPDQKRAKLDDDEIEDDQDHIE